MAKVICTKCGLTGDSKCPFCRSVFPDVESEVGALDSILSYRFVFNDPKMFKVKMFGEETYISILKMLRRLLNESSDADLAVFACTHEWDFEVGQKSDIDCGHGCDENTLKHDIFEYLNEVDVAAAEFVLNLWTK